MFIYRPWEKVSPCGCQATFFAALQANRAAQCSNAINRLWLRWCGCQYLHFLQNTKFSGLYSQ